MMRHRPVPLAFVFLIGFLFPTLSGCSQATSDEFAIPYPRLGDRVTFASSLTGSTITYDLVETFTHWLPIGKEIPAVRVRAVGFTSGGSTIRTEIHVNTLDNTILRFVNLCPETNEQGCSSLREESDRARGAPWGFGSSLLQGLSIRSGSEISRHFDLGGEAIETRLEIGRIIQANGTRLASVRAVSDGPGRWSIPLPTAAVAGDFEYAEGNPFVVRAAYSFPKWVPDSKEIAEIQMGIVQEEFSRGAGAVIPWGERAPPSEFPCVSEAGPLKGGLPPGADRVLGKFLSSFAEFVNYLESVDSRFASARGADGFFLPYLQMSNGTTFSAGDVLEDRVVKVRLRYHVEDLRTEWVEISKSFQDPNPLNRPPRFSHSSDGVHDTIYPRAIEVISPVPFSKVYVWHINSGPPWSAVSIEAAPSLLILDGKPSQVHLEYVFWSNLEGSLLRPYSYDARTGCPIARYYLEGSPA